MELGTIIGLISGLFFTMFTLLQTAHYDLGLAADSFLSLSGASLVLGGTIASTLIAYTLKKIVASLKAIKIIFKPPVIDPAAAIERIVALANTARKEGVLALEDQAQTMDDAFMKKGIMLIVDGTDPELVKGIMETELSYIDERHSDTAAMFDYMASQAPAWGMMGTLIGLILMLKNLSDPTLLGPGMSMALITTFYGSLIANYFCAPVANKLKIISKEEILLKTVLIEGMLSIQNGENPRIIEEKLKSFLSPAIRDNVGANSRSARGSD